MLEMFEVFTERSAAVEEEEDPMAALFFAVLGAALLLARAGVDLTVVVFSFEVLLLIEDKLYSSLRPKQSNFTFLG